MEVVALLTLAALAVVLVLCFLLFRKFGAVLRPRDLDPMIARIDGLERAQERIERSLRDENARLRDCVGADSRALREEVVGAMTGVSVLVQQQLEGVRAAVDGRLKSIQDDNATRLEQMRATVDEKLQGTLKKRLGESFRLVSERLEKVHQGLGECRSLRRASATLRKC